MWTSNQKKVQKLCYQSNQNAYAHNRALGSNSQKSPDGD